LYTVVIRIQNIDRNLTRTSNYESKYTSLVVTGALEHGYYKGQAQGKILHQLKLPLIVIVHFPLTPKIHIMLSSLLEVTQAVTFKTGNPVKIMFRHESPTEAGMAVLKLSQMFITK
jgi:hypothetical protein